MSTKIIAFFLALLLNLLATPAFAETPVWGTDLKAGEFQCGSAQKYEAGATTIAQVATAAASNWTACERQYGPGQCSVMAKGFTAGPRGTHCDFDQGHDYKDHAMGDSRAEQLYQAFATLVPGTDEHRLPNDVHWDTAVKAAYLIIRPKPEAIRVELQVHACNDDIDNDRDSKTDMNDPGCSSPTDDDEWNLPVDQNDRWEDLVPVIVREAATPCPVTVTGWWSLDDRQFHYRVEYGYCLPQCRTSDVSEKSGYQMRSPGGIARAASTHSNTVVDAAARGRLSWSELRTDIESPERVPGIEYVDQNGTEDKTMWFGRAAEITDRGDMIIVDFKSVCSDLIEAELVEEYTGIDGVVVFTGSFGGAVLGDGRELTTHPFGGGVAEFGIEVGSPIVAFLGTLGIGVSIDDNCNMPASVVLPQLRLGATLNRQGVVGGIIDVRGRLTLAPSYAVSPDDPATPENEYRATSAIGLVSPGFLVEGGPRFAFGRGVKKGFIAVTAGFGPTWRWIEPFEPGDVRVTLTGDASVNLALGWAF